MSEKKFEEELGEEQDLPIDPRLAIQMSYGTIRNIIDAIVELVTNSDDSYKRLEQDSIGVEGKIKIYVRRRKYSACERIELTDLAEGMYKEQLEEALRFAGETSGFKKGKSVRGLFGRGLKEAIITLGSGEIYTIKKDKLSKAIIWKKGNRVKCRPPQKCHTPSKEERKEIGIIEGNGTFVRINITNEKIKCPDYKTLEPQIINHYALRDINSLTDREITLELDQPDRGEKLTRKLTKYEKPSGKEVYKGSIKIPDFGDTVEIKIYESEEKLESPLFNPFARGGLLIKTAGAILENQLFRFANDEAACFFFGEVIWEGLAERLREEEEGLLDLNRGGIEWRYECCQTLQNELEKILEPLVEEKRKQLEVKSSAPLPEKTRKMLNQICTLLNRFAKDVLMELPPDLPPGEKIDELTIKPPYANIEIDKERFFSVYAPLNIINPSSDNIAEIKSDNPHIQILDPHIKLEPSRKYSDLYYKLFRAIGRIEGEEATITCKLGEHTATTVVRVAPLGKGRKRKKLTGPRGGFFRDIKANPRDNPAQRVRYDNGIIWIFTKFPVVSEYLDETLSPKTSEARTMLAELVGEAFCRFIAREQIDRGKRVVLPGGEIDAFSLAMDDLQKDFLHIIHKTILTYKL